jgi:NTE family protein
MKTPLALCWVLLAGLLAGCGTTVLNAPLNVANTPAFLAQAQKPRDIVGRHIVGLSLSGGGLRASAFAFGVIQGLADTPVPGGDLFDDLTFMSTVSGGSLTGAYVALNGRSGLARFRNDVLSRNFERDLRLSLLSPVNLVRLLSGGGVNDRSNLGATLDAEVFRGATFADLYRANKPDVWINATDLFNRTPFPFIPEVFLGLCSDLSQLRVSEAVAASMAVPLAFAPVVLKTYPDQCLTSEPSWLAHAELDPAGVAAGTVASTARAVRNYRDPRRMRYVKLADGGLTDNQGLASILIARAVAGNDYGPFREADAVRMRRMLFLIVDAGRPPNGDWALTPDGPSGIDVGLAAADAAIDSATRFSAAAFRAMVQDWRDSIVRFRCQLSLDRVRELLSPGEAWDCKDVHFEIGVIGFQNLPAEQAERMRNMPTRLALPAADIDAAIAAGRAAVLASPALKRYLQER